MVSRVVQGQTPASSQSGSQSGRPPVSAIRRNNTHRLIPSRFSENADSVLTRIADDDQHLQDLFALDEATNDRNHGENGLLDGIGPPELVFGIPYYRIVNAAYLHAHPLGSRFNGPERGAWYAAFELRTSQAEVAWHKSVELAEVNWLDQSVTYDDYLADFACDLHDLRPEQEAGKSSGSSSNNSNFNDCLDATSYVQSQQLAANLLASGSQGIVYPSVRRADGVCLACFRPALVYNVRKGKRYRFTWSGQSTPRISIDKPARQSRQ